MTLKYESIVTPDAVPTLSEREQWEQERAMLLHRLDLAAADKLTMESDLAMAMDALRELAGTSAATLVAIEGEVPV